MRPDLKDMLQERFHGHEAHVDPGVWDAIRSQITAGSPGNDPMEELFRERFQGHEMNVDPGVWNAINSQIAQGVAAGSGASGGGLLGWAAGGFGMIVISAGIYLFNTHAERPSERIASVGPVQHTEVVSVESRTPEAIALPVMEEVEISPVVAKAGSDITTNASIVTASLGKDRSDGTFTDAIDPTIDSTPVEVDRSIPMERLEPRMLTGGSEHAPLLPEGEHVVKEVIQQIKGEVHLGSMAAEEIDPKGPPEVELGEIVNAAPEKEKTSVLPDIFMPNTFTPNGDGINDTYQIDRTGFQSMKIHVYSLQNSTRVFSTDSNEEWDGASCEKGYYLVAIEAVTDDGRLVTKGKAVWLNNDRY